MGRVAFASGAFCCFNAGQEASERLMNEGKSKRIGNAIACGALVVVIVGLLVATWMPAIVAAKQKRVAATTQPTSQPTATTLQAETRPAE
jgi:hypothetical protein